MLGILSIYLGLIIMYYTIKLYTKNTPNLGNNLNEFSTQIQKGSKSIIIFYMIFVLIMLDYLFGIAYSMWAY